MGSGTPVAAATSGARAWPSVPVVVTAVTVVVATSAVSHGIDGGWGVAVVFAAADWA